MEKKLVVVTEHEPRPPSQQPVAIPVPTRYDINILDADKETELSKLRIDPFKIYRRQVID
jgi:hypothetical protein